LAAILYVRNENEKACLQFFATTSVRIFRSLFLVHPKVGQEAFASGFIVVSTPQLELLQKVGKLPGVREVLPFPMQVVLPDTLEKV
jgi:hypothetical protein